MNEREAIAVRDADGQLRWFPVAEAQRWPATTLYGGELFWVASQWVLLETEMSLLLGEPGQIVEEKAALEWLTRNGYAPPAELADCAQRYLLQ